jgi:flagellar hook-associated protein 1 FlgK
MSIPTFGIETGLRGLRAAQAALDTASHNIANANTPGYSRQRAVISAGDPYTVASFGSPVGAMQMGTGVIAHSIQQSRDAFLDQQTRGAYSDQQAALSRHDALSQVEDVIGEPGSGGINSALTNLFNSFHNLAADPANTAQRNNVVSAAQNVAVVVNRIAARLENSTNALDGRVDAGVAGVNDAAQRIAILNREIRKSVAQGDEPNDLRDQRGLLLDDLAKKVNTTVLPQPDGTVSVQVGGVSLVRGVDAFALSGISVLTQGADLTSGEMKGLVDAQADLSGVRAQLDGFANTFRDQMNTLHQGGRDKNGAPGVALFSGTLGAGDLAVNPDILADSALLAAASTATPFASGNGDNALALAGLATQKITAGPVANATLRDFWGGVATGIGVRVKSLADDSVTQDAYVRQQENRRDAISGVSLDDEMADMVRFQRAYQAAARIISMADELTGNLIEMAGGRA